ncbi:MAG: YfdX family protein [Candidatus Nitrotoga sp.]
MMISIGNISRYGFAAMVLVGLSQGYATAADSAKHTDSAKQMVPASNGEHNIVTKQRAATELLKQREALLVEAMTAHEEMLKAIVSLQKKDKDAAYKSLTEAAGKLDVVLARDPNLKLAVINVHSYSRDLEVTSAVVKDTVFRAYTQLTEGHIQQARALLDPMVSEIRVSTDSLPMETYPHAIKLASKEINDGKLKEAEQLLLDTLDTIITKENIIPLPPVKAEMAVLEAERLIKIDASKNRTHAVDLLNQAKQHLKVGKLLGYGDYKDINDEIAAAQSKINAGTPDTSLFSRLKEFFHKIGKKL